ncbi:hypothetical protein B0H19DRAFT_1239307 [Mycena capillaripes]|nr:hypothetical protein B0H19DRAFT_1239307 [Mycena capillaripes]
MPSIIWLGASVGGNWGRQGAAGWRQGAPTGAAQGVTGASTWAFQLFPPPGGRTWWLHILTPGPSMMSGGYKLQLPPRISAAHQLLSTWLQHCFVSLLPGFKSGTQISLAYYRFRIHKSILNCVLYSGAALDHTQLLNTVQSCAVVTAESRRVLGTVFQNHITKNLFHDTLYSDLLMISRFVDLWLKIDKLKRVQVKKQRKMRHTNIRRGSRARRPAYTANWQKRGRQVAATRPSYGISGWPPADIGSDIRFNSLWLQHGASSGWRPAGNGTWH